MLNVIPFELSTPRSMIRLALDAMQQSAAVARRIVPWTEIQLSFQEFQNKLDAFKLFEHVDTILQISPREEVCLRELVKRTETLEPYRAVWATEGLGHYLARRFGEQGGAPRNLLTDEGSKLSSRTLCALHAGMGLAFANRLMARLNPRSPEAEIRSVLQQFVTDCRENSSPGYAGVAYESLGLVTRNLYPHMIRHVAHQLKKFDEPMLDYFWHGVGRAIYFAPTNSLPDTSSSKRALQMTWEEPPDDSGRRNALAGLSWAMTLVNIRHPGILENFLKHHGHGLVHNDAFANGVSSSIMIWRDSTASDPDLKAFCNYKPDAADSVLAEQWKQMVHRPCMEALEHTYPVLQKEQRFGEVFRYVDLSTLVYQSGTGSTQAR